MKTSYFFSGKLNQNQNLVSISMKIPKTILDKFPNIQIYKPLCPGWQLVQDYKSGKITSKEYTERYIKYVLIKLDPQQVYYRLGQDAILLCWEKPGNFCHRLIVADWLETNLNIKIDEL